MSHIFISHATENDAVASEIAKQLRLSGLATWLDHENIPAGKDWDHAIEVAIRGCQVMLLLVSSHSLRSKVCGDEWSHALDLSRDVIPIIIDNNVPFDEMPFRLKRRQWIDLRGDTERGFWALLESLGADSRDIAVPVEVWRQLGISKEFQLPMLEWISIPAGEVTLRLDETKQATCAVSACKISKYPVMVMQFEVFVQDGGYEKREYWTQAGWEWKTAQYVRTPRFWLDATWHKPKHPIVGVSWYGALAFCQWLSSKLDAQITLPTEAQWQLAAQGSDGRDYPWGMIFDSTRANTRESGYATTTPSDMYTGSISPFGVYDMCGNAWEWCLDTWRRGEVGVTDPQGTHTRIRRGGSWREDQRAANVWFRDFDKPLVRESFIGFRMVMR